MAKFIASSDIESLITTTVPKGIKLFTIEDFEKFKREIDAPTLDPTTAATTTKNNNTHEYKLLKNDEKFGYQLWVKSKGEGSGTYNNNNNNSSEQQVDCIKSATSQFLRHKYTCQLPMSTSLFYDVSRDYVRRLEWDKRDGGRKILKIIHVQNEPNGIEYQVIEQMIKKVGSVMSDRECITLTAEYWDKSTNTCYWLSKSIDDELANELIQQSSSSSTSNKLNNSGLVRSDVLYLGMIMKPLGANKMEYWCVTQLDPKGWLPANIMNWATQFIPKAFKREIIHASEMRMERDPSSLTYINYYQPPRNKSTVVSTTTTTTTTTAANVVAPVEQESTVSSEPAVEPVQEQQEQQQEQQESVAEEQQEQQPVETTLEESTLETTTTAAVEESQQQQVITTSEIE